MTAIFVRFRPARRFLVTSLALVVLSLPHRAAAQDPPPRIGPFVLDLRGTAPSFPADAQLAQSRGLAVDELPGRGLGFDAGAHVYLFRWRVMTVGIGGQLTVARATSPGAVTGGLVTARPVTTEFGALTPQLSFNFGSGDGWSYISGGIGQAIWSIVPEGQPSLPGDEERLRTINYGGGARWFLKRHLAFTFDVRFHALDPGTPFGGFPGSPRTTLLVIGAGVSVK